MTLTRVLVWQVVDPKQRLHVAGDNWRYRGLTLCGRPISTEAPGDHVGDPCGRCLDLELQVELGEEVRA